MGSLLACLIRWVLLGSIVALTLLPLAARAEMPPHLVLTKPAARAPHSPYSPSVGVSAQPYPYGYFGPCAWPQWQRQFGVNRTYTQWSQR
jgi:hypothetical protein